MRVLWIAVAAVALAGCGSQAKSDAPPVSAVDHAFRHSPAELATLHAQADQLLGGGPRALQARLASLRGYPIVLNEWASWCEPCQSEFPVYQKVAVALGRRVAFLGLDAKDTNASAATFLRRFPVTYPSYTDPNGAIASALHLYTAYPQTIYFNRAGVKVFDHAGPYETVSSLEQDIHEYLKG
jgi:cytochrome c biogenesis protein CcmG, thiol:disulfide interchange protein DsbE